MTDNNNPQKASFNRRDLLKSACHGTAALAFLGAAGRVAWPSWPCFHGLEARATTRGGRSGRRNIVFVLSDDHRYDFMGFMENSPAFLETPNMDRMARQGAHLANAFVSTSLCSPSRASILTGQYMHHHRIADNQRPEPEGTVFFPRYLQEAGYQTAFVGKWHMGHDHDAPRPGFDHWASFKGQGTYFDPTLNINNKRRKFEG
ncbi:MAG: sulfatase-like hydrolase/transferase, partial [Planctomycetota bacterium]|nr:sulfatase-like hydrolase/transferase [Planctomycetota bacterium]